MVMQIQTALISPRKEVVSSALKNDSNRDHHGPTSHSWKIRFMLSGLLGPRYNVLCLGHSCSSVDGDAEAERLSGGGVGLEFRASSSSSAGSTHCTCLILNRMWSLLCGVTFFYSGR